MGNTFWPEGVLEWFEGVEGAFILLPPVYDSESDFPDVLPRIAVIREALYGAQPPKVVVLSTIGADAARPNLLNVLRLLEEAFAGLPVAVMFLRAAWFMENAAWDIAARVTRVSSTATCSRSIARSR
ncbi:hypothetical protein FJ420_05040 [Mesorhizobium sp. B3-1-3]|uniref:hypothetical protein n=1 Tax=unclassified Mesorhizobium TaxID=325217 RepID=UPI001128B78D|nr:MULTISPECIES: hypothetical protein [unclassified Mesorhizobium]TPI69148.1 hypothetical protein FJ424_07125 [Mesorhizobium sp. B3-1-8]TPI74915.1 hypothetical protein FJ420_05040 [Mesorhizobium sp. B3-1-3]